MFFLCVRTNSANPNQPPASGPNSFDPSGNNHPPRDIDDDSENKRSNAFQIESAIWTFDARHKSITGSFINPNRSTSLFNHPLHAYYDTHLTNVCDVPEPVTVELFYNPQSPPGVDLVSDVHAYKRANHHAFPIVSPCTALHVNVMVLTHSFLEHTDRGIHQSLVTLVC